MIRSAVLFAVLALAIPLHAQTFRVPFRTVNSMILLDSQVNGKAATLVLDTAAIQTQIDRKFMAQRTDWSVLYVDLRLTAYRNGDFRILATDLRQILKGIPADGILGEDWLCSFRVVRIDYKASVIEFEK